MSRYGRTRRIVLFWAAAALIAAIEAVFAADLLVGAASSRVFSSLDDVPAREVGMVLGVPKYSKGRPSPLHAGRIRAAAELYHAGKVKKLVVSGACRPKSFYYETAAMKRDLMELGVPEEKIMEDDKGLRTLDSILRMRDVFGYDDFITISQRDHCARALYLADHHHISTIGFEAGIQPGIHPDELFFSAIRESLAYVKAVLDVATDRRAKYPTER